MTRATCTACGKMAYLKGNSPQGTEYWFIKDAIRELINKLKGHKCVK
ncbi:hypothetical protein LCGC14_2030950 [marine sediment metagenome]|uniref:Uncharacterized protein n=1 Tax=marine sediment metagenome TaxID=412755 RepID=A0A0F9EUS1_9ZZZZ